MNRKKKPIATAWGSPMREVACSVASRLLTKLGERRVVVGVGPADVDPGEHPGGHDHQSPEQDAEREPGKEPPGQEGRSIGDQDRKSTRLNSSHLVISYAVFC